MAYTSTIRHGNTVTLIIQRLVKAWKSAKAGVHRRRAVASPIPILDERLRADIGLTLDHVPMDRSTSTVSDQNLMRHMVPSPWWGPGNDTRLDYWLREHGVTGRRSSR